MQADSVEVEAANEDHARALGAMELGVKPDEVVVEPTGGPLFKARLKNAPGHVALEVAEDNMSATIARLTPPTGDGAPVTMKEVEDSLRSLSVTYGVDRAAIAGALDRLAATGEVLEDIRIAAGTPPTEGRDATLELRLGPDAAIRDPAAPPGAKPGQVLAVKTPAVRGVAGHNVLGERIPASDGRDRRFVPGENVTLSPDGTVFESSAYGLAAVTASSISVKKSVQVSPDARYAEMALFPTLADGSPLTADDVHAALADAGVVHGIMDEVITAALEAHLPMPSMRVAEGTPPKDGVDARIEFRFCLNGTHPEQVDAERREESLAETDIVKELVVEGDILAIKTPSAPAEDGMAVTGRPIAARQPVLRKLQAGAGVALLDDGVTFVVAEGAAGYANLVAGALSVEDPLAVTEDKMQAHIVVHPPPLSGKTLTPDLAAGMLNAHAIVGSVDTGVVEEALVRAENEGRPVPGVVVARGTPPEHGEDASVRLAFSPCKVSGTIIPGTDRMDYRERGTIQNIREGGLLAEKTPPTPGVDGTDVFGEPAPARPGKDKTLKVGKNVRVSDDGLRYLAEIDGAATLIGDDTVAVFKEYEVPGDVDYATGNLDMDGSVRIRGWVRSGFVVRASGDVVVGEGIEDATVDAGGNVEISGGIVGTNSGTVRARGHVTARFIQSARVEAGGGVFVEDSVIRSRITAEGRVEMSGTRGCVMGGLVTASRAAEVGELGAQSGVTTLIDVGMDARTRAAVAKYEDELATPRRLAKKVRLAASLLARKNKAGGVPATEARLIAKLAKFRRQTAVLESRLEKLRQAAGRACTDEEGGEPVTVKVRTAAHEGTVVGIGGYRRVIREEIRHGGDFVLNTKNWSVEYQESGH